MQITSSLGNEIINRVVKYTEIDINIMDLVGRIVSSTNGSRVGEKHEGAVEVLKTSNELIIDDTELLKYPGTRQGVNLPIKHNNKTLGVVGVSGDPKDIYKFTGLILTAVEVVIEQLYIERKEYFRERQWIHWVQQLLHPSGFDSERLIEEAEYLLKIDVQLNWRTIILRGQVKSGVVETVRSEVKDNQLNSLFILPFSEDEIVISIPSSIEQISNFIKTVLEVTGKEFKIGIGEKGFGLLGIRNSYFQARQALDFGRGELEISKSSEWKWERIIVAIENTEYQSVCLEYENEFAKLGSIYTETIDAYFKMNLSIKKTAEYLYIHRNTLLYRLEQIKKYIGLDPRCFHEACILRIIRTRIICANIQNVKRN
ncbi:CdaR family transcriptional regulator [Virgibacillus sp. W0181]|uniref:CdaR family transcriptional regulator n=1 Tax=Virgibacillus sp. W0181 TaxID=3391581 RepID=UPI003F4648A7